MRMALLQERISASDAADWGLIARVCAPEEVDQISQGWAARCATTPRGALGATKAAINAAVLGHESSPFGNLSVALEREHSSQLVFLESPEHKESVKKFLSRRA